MDSGNKVSFVPYGLIVVYSGQAKVDPDKEYIIATSIS